MWSIQAKWVSTNSIWSPNYLTILALSCNTLCLDQVGHY
jgi:hypothetical protein